MIGDSPLKLSIITYLIFSIILIVLRPKHIFNDDNTLKTTGIGSKNTLFSLPILLITCSILIYYFYTILFHIVSVYINKTVSLTQPITPLM